MKKIFKVFLIIAITATICVSTTIYAASVFYAKDIKFSSYNENFKATNVEDAINELYTKKQNQKITSGEAFLKIAGTSGIEGYHNGDDFTGYVNMYNLDFSNILSFDYSYVLTTTNTTYQEVRFYDATKDYLKIISTSNGTLDINKATNVNYQMRVTYKNRGTFRVSSYTTIDGVVHTF